MKKLEDLFEHQLKDLYSAEEQLIEALPEMAKNAKDSKLKKAFEDHLEETKQHKKRLEEISKELGFTPTGEKCLAMEGLIKEARNFLKEDADEDVKNAGMIAEAQRIEHYEISAYGTAVRYAKELGHEKVAKKLHDTLDEEYEADEKLNDLAEDRINKKAMSKSN
jgi:ferritin-like metal-binding protein YciE